MKTIKRAFNNEKVRAYVYRVLIALGTAAVFYGMISDEELVLWSGILTVIFNTMPAAKTSTQPDAE